MAGKKTSAPKLRSPATAIRIGDKVKVKSHLGLKKGEVYEVVDIVTVTIMNEQRRVDNIHVSNLDPI
jgi:hypothetical protein